MAFGVLLCAAAPHWLGGGGGAASFHRGRRIERGVTIDNVLGEGLAVKRPCKACKERTCRYETEERRFSHGVRQERSSSRPGERRGGGAIGEDSASAIVQSSSIMSPNHGDHGRGQVCDRDSRGRRGRSLQASSDGQCQGMDKNGGSWGDHVDHEIAQARCSGV